MGNAHEASDTKRCTNHESGQLHPIRSQRMESQYLDGPIMADHTQGRNVFRTKPHLAAEPAIVGAVAFGLAQALRPLALSCLSPLFLEAALAQSTSSSSAHAHAHTHAIGCVHLWSRSLVGARLPVPLPHESWLISYPCLVHIKDQRRPSTRLLVESAAAVADTFSTYPKHPLPYSSSSSQSLILLILSSGAFAQVLSLPAIA